MKDHRKINGVLQFLFVFPGPVFTIAIRPVSPKVGADNHRFFYRLQVKSGSIWSASNTLGKSFPVGNGYAIKKPEKHTHQLERAEHYIYLAAGYILVLAAAGLLLAALIEMAGSIV